MSRAIKGGWINQSTVIRIVDSTTGLPEEGVVAATTGLALWYRREGATKTALGALNDLATLDAAHNDNGILHIDDGYYRLDLPDAAFAVASSGVAIGGTATGMVVIGAYHPIDQPASTFESGMVWVDTGGTASSAWPYGTANFPTTTIALGKVIADANNLNTIHVKGNHTLVAAMEGYNFIGGLLLDATELINAGGQSIEHSSFRDCVVTGAGGNTAGIGNQSTYTDCYLYQHTNIQGWIYNGRVDGACSILDLGYATFHNALFGSGVACTLTLNAPVACDIENMAGELTLAGMDGGVCSVSMTRGSILTIDNTCTAGAITVTGAGTVTDNSGGGCAVDIQVAEADLIQLGSDAQSATDLKDFADAGYDPATNKVQGVVLTDTCTANTDMRGTDGANTTKTGYTLTNLTDASAGKLDDMLDGTGAVLYLSQLSIQANDAAGAVDIDNSGGEAINISGSTNGIEVYGLGGSGIGLYVAGVLRDIQANVTGSISVATGGITAASIATDAIDADAIKADAVTKIQSGLSTLTAAQVNAQVLDVLNVDTFAEPGQGTPAATTTIQAKIGYLYKAWRNKVIQDATTLEIYNDAGAVVDQKATISDDGTDFTRGKIGSGP